MTNDPPGDSMFPSDIAVNWSSIWARWLVVASSVAACGVVDRVGAAEASFSPTPPAAGVVAYRPAERGEELVLPRFRLASHEFHFESTPLPEVSTRIGMSEVRFPSPVKTESAANNTVHCEFFYPKRPGKCPAVIVLHILGGDFDLARLFANNFAQHGVAALFLKMPYYGPRRDPGSTRRMISSNPDETVEGMTQAVLDIRHATAWLAAQSNVDEERLGIFGISLGGITGALAASAEPRLNNVCLMLAGGDLGRIAWESKELERLRLQWLTQGHSREEFLERLRVIDPVRYGANLQGRRILMLNARNDEVIPKSCTVSLWESVGKPPIEWYTGGHYSVVRHLFTALHRTSQFFVESR